MAVQKIAALIRTTGNLKALADKARRLAEWQKRYADSAPPALARASRVAGFRSGTLLLWADNAAVAAKLKQLTPRLMTAMNKEANEVTSIRVQVQPARITKSLEKRAAKPGLTPRVLDHFVRLSETVPDPGLKTALETLVAHHRGRRAPVK